MKIEALRTSESLAIDVVRVSAAALVAIGHLSQPYFSTGGRDLTFLARAAVAVFFVLSGFVIRHVTCRHRGTFDIYLKDRASRIYSVVLPALLFTLMADTISRHVNPLFYAHWAQSYQHPLTRILENLAFTAQLWTRDVMPLSNSPFWSLNYEVAYYLMYGFAFYLNVSRKWLSIGITMLIVGPKIFLLFPVWLIGCFAHDRYQKWNTSGKALSYVNRAAIAGMLCAAAGTVAVYSNHRLLHLAWQVRDALYLVSKQLGLGMSGSLISFYAIGLFGTIFFLRLLLFARQFQVQRDARLHTPSAISRRELSRSTCCTFLRTC